MGWEEGFVLSLLQAGGRQQAGVDAHGHLVHNAIAGMAQPVGRGLQQRARRAGRGQQVSHGGWRGVGQQGGLPTQVGAAWQVAGAALGQGEGVAGHGAHQERLLLLLRAARGEVAVVPLLRPRGEVLDLAHTHTHREREKQAGLRDPRSTERGKMEENALKLVNLKSGGI